MDVGGAVPACVDEVLAVAPPGCDRRQVRRPPAPRHLQRAVVLAAVGQVGVEEQLTVVAVLREVRRGAPADEDVAVRQNLGAPERMREQRWVVRVLLVQRRAHARRVERDHERLRLRLHLGRRPVVEEADQLVGRAVMPRVVLEREAGARAHGEVALLATQPPDDLAAAAVDLVHGPGVAGGDEEVAVGIELDRVDVEVVVRALVGDARMRFVEADVVEAAPLEQHATTWQLELLHDASDHRAVREAAQAREVRRHSLPGGDERRAVRGEQKLVQVGRPAAARRHAHELAIAVVDDHVRPVAETVLGLALPPREGRLAAVDGRTEVQRHDGLRRPEPHRLAALVALPGPGERRQEEVAVTRPRIVVHRAHDRGHEIGPGAEEMRLRRLRGAERGVDQPDRPGARTEQQRSGSRRRRAPQELRPCPTRFDHAASLSTPGTREIVSQRAKARL